MFLPLCDLDNPVKRIRRPYVNFILIGLNVVIFVFLQSGTFLDPEIGFGINFVFGVLPFELTTAHQIVPEAAVIPEGLTLVSYMFLHGGWLHLAGNMVFLWTFGDNVEDAMGHGRYLAFYLLCGASGALMHVAIFPISDIPLVGASGAIAGTVAAYLMLHPRVRLWCLFAGRFPLKISARFALGGWVSMQFLFGLAMLDDGIAWWAHIGGLMAGAVLIIFMRSDGVPLFDRGLTSEAGSSPRSEEAASVTAPAVQPGG